MPRALLLAALLLVSWSASAGEWVSPIDVRYRNQSPQLFQKTVQARHILDSWRGQRGKWLASVHLLNQVLKENEGFAPAYREYARAVIMAGFVNDSNYREGALERAEDLIHMAIEIEPEYADAYVLLGHVYTSMDRYPDARSALETAEQIGTEIPWLHLNWGDLLQKQGKYEQAMQRFQRVVVAKPQNSKAYASARAGVTSTYIQMGEYEQARAAFEKEVEFEPESAWQWGNYANFLLFTYGDVDLAIEKGRMALQLMDYGMGRFVLASALYTKWAMIRSDPEDDRDAKSYFDEAWSLYPYPKRVIKEALRYSYTHVTARELRRWVRERNKGTTEGGRV